MSLVFTTRASRLTETLEFALKDPATSSEFDLMAHTNDVLSDVGLTVAHSQMVMSRTKESYRTVFAPRGSSKPQWRQP